MSNTTKKQVAGGLTQAEIDNLKKLHGPLTLVTVKSDPVQHFWFRKPDRNVLSAASSAAIENPILSLEIYFKNCLVSGDESAINDVDIFSTLMPHLNELIERKETEVKNF